MSQSSPSIVPHQSTRDVYLVMDDLGGRLGRIWSETDAAATDWETMIADLLDCQYKNPVQIVAFNTSERWSRDVSKDVVQELRHRCDQDDRALPSSLQAFVERYVSRRLGA